MKNEVMALLHFKSSTYCMFYNYNISEMSLRGTDLKRCTYLSIVCLHNTYHVKGNKVAYKDFRELVYKNIHNS